MDRDEFIPTRKTLLSRLKDWKDQTSWREFFDTYGRLIYGVARKAGLTEAEAQDALQETLLAVTKKMPGFTYDPAKDSFKGWLVRITQWKIADQFRKRITAANLAPASVGCNEGTRTATIERIADPGSCDLEAVWDEEWQANLLATALDRVKRRVKPELYEIYHLHIVKEQSATDVARALNVSAAKVYLAKHRVGRLLRKEIRHLEQARK